MFWIGTLCGFAVGSGGAVMLIYKSSNNDILKLREEVDNLLDSTEVDEFVQAKWKIVRDKFTH